MTITTNISKIKVINPHFETETKCTVNYCIGFDIWNEVNTKCTNTNSDRINFIYQAVLDDTTLSAVENAVRIREIDNEKKTISVIKDTNKSDLINELSSGMGGNQTYTLSSDTFDDYNKKLEAFTSDWYTVNLNIDFKSMILNGTIENKATGNILKTFENEPITTGAKYLNDIYAYDVYSAAPMSIDNVYISEIK